MVTIFAEPGFGAYASVGAWTNGGEWVSAGYPATPDEDFSFVQVASDAAQQPIIQYAGSNAGYQVRLPGSGFETLRHSANVANPTADNLQFTLLNGLPFTISGSRSQGYRYSEMARWWQPDLDFGFTAQFGVVAFGMPTSPSGIPLTGSATYQGNVWGITDATAPDGAGGYFFLPAEGNVTLAFNFGTGTLGGSMHLFLNEGMGSRDLGSFAFNQTLYSSGSTTYSGNFATTLQGFNFFNGRFTGPNAEETIGNWAVPFQYQGNTQQALGAWIARRGD